MRKILKRATCLGLLLGAASGLPSFAQTQFFPGIVKAEVYSGFGGTAIANLTNNPAFPNNPSSISFVKFIEYPAGGDDGTPPAADVSANYGVRLSGVIVPKETANYVFYIASDDAGEFYLSTDENPANKRLLAFEPTWNPVRSFDIDSSGGRVECLNGDCENVSDPVSLTANTRYYFEALMKEEGGGDNLAIAWAKEGELLEQITYVDADGFEQLTYVPIRSEFIGVVADTQVAITRQPSDAVAATGGIATFSVGVNATPNVTYQWKKNGANITGATGRSYTTPTLTATDDGATYTVEVTNGENTVVSEEANLRVVPTEEIAGGLLFEAWPGIGGTTVPTDLSVLGTAPTDVALINRFDTRVIYPDDTHDNYLARISGYFIPKVTGNYDFFLRSDDSSALWISSDATLPNPATATPVARETDCCDAFQEPFVANDDGTTYPTTEAPIAMVAGRKYGILMLVKEGGGGDFGQVAFRLDTDFTDAASLQPISADYLATVAATVAISTQPVDISVEENRTGTFAVQTLASIGNRYQWQSAPAGSEAFTDIAGATNRTLTVNAPRGDNGRQFRVVVSSPDGEVTETSAAAILTVTDDITPPTITQVGSFHGGTGVIVYFNEAVDADSGAYTLSGGATVQSSTQVGPNTVFLQTAAALSANTSYTLTVSNVRDLSANGGNLVSPNVATFTTAPAAPTPMTEAFAKYQRWEFLSPNDINGLLTAIADLPPDVEEAVLTFEAPTNVADGHGSRLTGWVIPPEDGDYVFAMATDDNGRLWLSTDSNPANKKLIASETGWSGVRAWSGGIPQKNSDTFTGTEWPTGSRISLKGGQPYYIELIWQDGSGGDNGSATFWLAGSPDSNGTQTRIRGDALVGNVTLPLDGPPIVVTPPQGRIFNKGDDFSLTVEVLGQGPLTYQWLKNKKIIPGATSATYAITDADHTDVGDYSVLVSNANGSVESNYDTADDNARLLMTGGFTIEAEDYNYEGGKHLPIASTMPYLGNAYSGLAATLDVDFFNGPDDAGGSVDAYAYGPRLPVSAEGNVETKGGNADAVNNAFNRQRGSTSVTANYAVGWTQMGDWQNYTRNFPAGTYAILAAGAQDGTPDPDPAFPDPASRTIGLDSYLSRVANPTVADGSAVGVEGGNQGLTRLGVFQSPTSGGWSSNDLIPLTDETSGQLVTVELDGTETLRWTNNGNQDMDYLILYCLDCATNPTEPTLEITRNAAGTITITFTGTLYASDTVDGDYAPVAGASSPYTVEASGANRFYQAVGQ